MARIPDINIPPRPPKLTDEQKSAYWTRRADETAMKTAAWEKGRRFGFNQGLVMGTVFTWAGILVGLWLFGKLF